MNMCVFTGRTTKDVELRMTQDNMAVANVALAVDDGYGDKKTTSFFNLTAFGKTAESMEKYVTKGTKILVTARAKQNKWQDKNGNNRYDIGFIVTTWEFAQAAGEATQAQPQAKPEPDKDGFLNVPDGITEELPFL